jgi:hypothetical protein
MALVNKFRNVVATPAVSVSSLSIDNRYPVLQVEHVETKYGPTIRMALREKDDNIVKVFLPQRYAVVFSDEDVADITERRVLYHLMYKGKSSSSNAQLLHIEQ